MRSSRRTGCTTAAIMSCIACATAGMSTIAWTSVARIGAAIGAVWRGRGREGPGILALRPVRTLQGRPAAEPCCGPFLRHDAWLSRPLHGDAMVVRRRDVERLDRLGARRLSVVDRLHPADAGGLLAG